jgi:putative ABC transport system permease protein
VRLAIGAALADIARLISKRILPIIAIGLLSGGVLYIAAAQWIRSVLFGVDTHGPVSIAVALIFVASVAIVAAIVPTIRATRLDPASILRD